MDNDGKLVNPKTLVEFDQSTTTILSPTSSVAIEKESCSLGLITSTTSVCARISKSQDFSSGVKQKESVQDSNSVVGRNMGGVYIVGFGDGHDASVVEESLRKEEGVGIEKRVGEEEKEVKEGKFGEEVYGQGGGMIGDDVSGDTEKVCGKTRFGLRFQDGISSFGRNPFAEMSSSIAQRMRNRVVSGKGEGVGDADARQNGCEIGEEVDEENGFSLGDFLWGKVKSHPWWPRRIYDPSYASELALKYKHEGRLLVAYFGDKSFAWCDTSQLMSFEENFEEMLKQSSLRAFVNVV